jgi:hypothetical protein
MTTAGRRTASTKSGLPAVGTAVLVRFGKYRHPGTVLEHRNGQAWVEFFINGTEEPRHMLRSAEQLEYPS